MTDPRAPERSDAPEVAEELRHAASELLAASFRASQDAVVILRASDETILDVNPAWSDVTGMPREAVLGRCQRDLDLWSAEDSVRFSEHLRRHGSVNGFEFAFKRKDPARLGEVGHAVLTAQSLVVDGVEYAVVVGRDVTEERRRAAQRDQARRLEELGQLAGGVAHDFNNLLTVIIAYAELVRDDGAAGRPAAAHDVDEVLLAATRAAALTRRLLAFSRNQPIERRPVGLNTVVRDSERLLRPLLTERTRLMLALEPDVPIILADPTQLTQVLLNFAANAAHAMPDGGEFEVATSAATYAEWEVAAAIDEQAPPGTYAVLRVRDTGAGMTPEVQARVFEPFFTTKPVHEGSGLGLAVVHGVVRQAGGFVRIDSAPGRGTTITVWWPAAPAGSAPGIGGGAVRRRADDASGGRTVLLVEDEQAVRGVLRHALERAGYTVVSAADGVEALAALDAHPEVDIVLSDLVMPNMDGRALAERLWARAPDLPVILMTGYAPTGDARAGLPNVVAPVLAKPFTLDELESTLSAWLGVR
jgi:two-component system cell cycle sensor histidine kinase/response regulator CckA